MKWCQSLEIKEEKEGAALISICQGMLCNKFYCGIPTDPEYRGYSCLKCIRI